MPSSYPVAGDCLFCKIVAGQIPCARVYEDEAVIAFLDINPATKGHTLVVPKGHYPTLLELPQSMGEALLFTLRLVARVVYEQTGAGGFNVIQNNFAPAGQTVFHAHWHIIPRFKGDGLLDWTTVNYKDSSEIQDMALALSARITG